MNARKTLTGLVLAMAIVALGACDSAEERAEQHYQSGLAYLEAGDLDRALVEFRNVFKLNGNHREARRSYAEIERGRGRLREAFAQYLRLAEQFPDDLDAARALAEIAAEASDWATAGRYAEAARAAAPDDAGLRAIRIAADYGIAIETNDVARVVASAAAARALRADLPDNLLLRRVIIDDHVRAEDFDEALAELDGALALVPDDRTLRAQRLSVLAALGDDPGVEAGLRDMVARFPDDPEMGTTLVRWHVARREIDKAEAFLRGRIDPAAPDQQQVFELVRFLAEERGADAASAELERVIASGQDAPAYRAAHAAFIFDLGRQDEAIAAMRALLDSAAPSAEARQSRIGLARMLSMTGDAAGARALVHEVLAEDPGDAEALKLKARWLILGDSVGDSIAVLRRALAQTPRDAEILTLMAEAYERDGNHDLVRESLARAVAAANRAPAESLRYARFLAAENKLLPAEGVLIDALRIAPGDASLLVPLGRIYMRAQDWHRADSVAAALEALDDPAARAAAQEFRAASIAARQDTDQAIAYLQGLVDEGAAGLSARIAILRAHLDSGNNAKARAYSARLLATDPADRELRFIDASVRALTGDAAGAETVYRALLDEDPRLVPAWMALIRLVAADAARLDEATALVDAALAVLPQADDLNWARAGLLEKGGDIEAAIAVYEAMYRANSANPIVANNLASLLSNHRSDAESIARAAVIARRLRGSSLAPYQDTYGWIAHLRGNHDEAIAHLEKAAATLDRDPTVQYHLAMAYLARDRRSEALARFRNALALLEPGDARAFAVGARREAARLEAEGVTLDN